MFAAPPLPLSPRAPRPARTALLAAAALGVAAISATACAPAASAHGARAGAVAPLGDSAPTDTDVGEAVVAGTDTSWYVGATSFRLVSSSRAAADGAAPSLESAARGFFAVFGMTPPSIGVVVVDTTNRGALRLLANPPDGVATVRLVGSGSARTPAARALARSALGEAAALGAAQAWVDAHSAAWTMRLRGGPAPSADSADDGAPDAQLPGWLEVAAIRAVADPSAEGRATREMRHRLDDAMPIAALFAAGVDDDALGALIRVPLGDAATAAPHDGGTTLFVAEATSLLAYLRETQGPTIAAGLVPPLLAGYDMRTILSRLPTPTTPEALEADWRAWVLAGGAPAGAVTAAGQ